MEKKMASLLTKDQKTPGAPKGVKNFTYSEMEYYDRIPANLMANADKVLQNLQVLRDVIGKPITIMSGYRSPERNAAVSGAKKSQHMEGNAVDIKVKDTDPKDVAKVIEKLISDGKMEQGGLGIYPRASVSEGWVHYDTRGQKARWEG
jgi:uncharacterized protein YcbK (DUF882 family)